MLKIKLLQFLEIVLLVILIVLPVRLFLFEPFFVLGDSMLPNYENYDYLIIEKISYRLTEPKRGDVIIFRPPVSARAYYIKRLVGLPSETLKIEDGRIYVYNSSTPSGFVLNEPYLTSKFTPGNYEFKLKQGEYLVLGDNREESYDSRKWGSIHKRQITGRVLVRVIPLREIVKIIKIGFAR
jgi:signal peptidase I